MSSPSRLLALLVLVAGLAACGLKSDLTLPPPEATEEAPENGS